LKKWCFLKIYPNAKVKIDSEDLKRLSEYSWRVTKGTTGRARVVTSIRKGKKVQTITLGKFLMKPAKGKQVYPRRYQDGLDYRKENLIVCSLRDRQKLLPKRRSDASSNFKGVSYNRSKDVWRAGITLDGVSVNLGDFNSETEAAEAYNKAARKHFGEFAYQNNFGRGKTRRGER
jgi:hypothetical protein